MMTTSSLGRARVALMLLIVTASAVQAQGGACDAAANRLAGPDRGGVVFRQDVQLMPGCPNGAASLALVWATAPSDLDDLQALLDASLRYHDGRLFGALQAATISAQASPVRIGAAAAMTSYIDSSLAVSLPRLLAGPGASRLGVVTWVSGAGVARGEVAAPPTARSDALATIEALAGPNIPADIRGPMTRLQAGVYNVIDVSTAGVRLTYICGNRFRVRNPTPAALRLRYDVYQTDESEDFTSPPREHPNAFSDTYITTQRTGTVRLFYGTQLLQTKANGNVACQ